MEYILLGLLAIPLFVIYRIIFIGKKIPPKRKIIIRQSRSFAMISNIYRKYLDGGYEKKRQSTKFFDQKHPRIVIMDGNGYWIDNNAVYSAPFDENGIDKDSMVKLDTMSMNDVELGKLLFIVEQLRKGLDDEDSGKWY